MLKHRSSRMSIRFKIFCIKMNLRYAWLICVMMFVNETSAEDEDTVTTLLPRNETLTSMQGMLHCYVGIKLQSEIMEQNTQISLECKDDGVCAQVDAKISAIFVHGQLSIGYCIPSTECNKGLCAKAIRTFASTMPQAELQTCQFQCCHTNLCNNAVLETVTEPTAVATERTTTLYAPTPNSPERISCYTGIKLHVINIDQNLQTITICPKDFICAKIHASTGDSSFQGHVSYGHCVPFRACGSLSCDRLLNVLSSDIATRVQNCSARCCSFNLCNEASLGNQVLESSTASASLQDRGVTLYELWTRAFQIEDEMELLIPSWYEYLYDGSYPVNQIRYGGNYMYYNGNRVRFFKENDEASIAYAAPLNYNQDYNYADYDLKIGGRNHPFMALAWIKNPTGAYQTYIFQVRGSTGSDGSSRFESNSGTIATNNFLLKFHFFQVYGDQEPSICEVYIVLSSDILKSSLKSSFRIYEFSKRRNMLNSVRLEGRSQRVLMGYILLSKSNGGRVTKFEIERLLNRLALHILLGRLEPLTPPPTPEPTTIPLSPCGTFPNATFNPQPFYSPGSPGSYPHNLDCTWSLYGVPGYLIKIDFESFVTEQCCDYLSIKESRHSVRRMQGAPVLEEPSVSTVVSSSDSIELKFHSDSSVSQTGFRATYRLREKEPQTTAAPETTVSPAPCGFEAVASSERQDINSPGWPNEYANNVYCVWTISTSTPGNRILFDFTVFQTEFCCDLLTIAESLGEQSREFKGTFSSIDPRVISQTDRVIVTFQSDTSVVNEGFQATFQEVGEIATTPHVPTTQASSPPSECGSFDGVTATEQHFASPGFPNRTYDINLNCEWLFETKTPGNRIKIDLRSFDSEACCDYLSFIENGVEVRRMKGIIRTLQPFISQTGALTLLFHSDNSVNRRGFHGTFRETTEAPATSTREPTTTTAPCGFRATATTDLTPLNSPGWPLKYDSNLVCEWTITASKPQNRIHINFTSFATEQCCDFLKIMERGIEFRRLQGTSALEPYNSITSTVILRFVSDVSIQQSGFEATFKEIETAETTTVEVSPTTIATTTTVAPAIPGCGGTFIANSSLQPINSPEWPQSYRPLLDCEWVITTATPGSAIRVQFSDFYTDPSGDFLEIRENGVFRRRFQGRVVDPKSNPFVSSTGRVVLRFISDQYITAEGFHGTYQQVEGEAVTSTLITPTVPGCGGTFNATNTSQPLNSPEWPRRYRSSLDCEWIISSTTPGHLIRIQFSDFFTDAGGDFLTIRENGIFQRRLEGRVVDPRSNPFLSSTGRVVLRFISDQYITAEGFQGTFEAINPRQPLATSPSMTTQEPKTTLATPKQCLCDQGYFYCEKSQNCSCYPDHWICDEDADCSDGSDEQNCTCKCPSDQFPCGYIADKRCQCVTMTWRCDGEDDCFDGSDEQDCNQTTTSSVQATTRAPCGFDAEAKSYPRLLHSTNFPGTYPSFEACRWNISTNSTQDRIQIDFESFWTERCCDVLEMWEDGKKVHEMGGYILSPISYLSNSNQVMLKFSSDERLNYNGFNATFKIISKISSTTSPFTTEVQSTSAGTCGFNAVADNNTQTITSPGWPGHYLHSQDCRWIITAPSPDKRIRIDFVHFWTEACCDYLAIFENGDETRRLKDYYPNSPDSYTSFTDRVILRFVSDPGISQSGFRAKFKLDGPDDSDEARTTAPCGFIAIATASPQPLNSPMWPGRYLSRIKCEWRITTRWPEYRIQIHFIVFLTESCCDALKIYENDLPKRRIAGLLSSVDPYFSTSQSVKLTFESDGAVTYAGFQATFQEYLPPPTTTSPPTTFTTTVGVKTTPAIAPCGPEALNATFELSPLNSPGWPSWYPNKVTCRWYITAPRTGHRIRIEFGSFLTEDCCDYLKIYESGFETRRMSGFVAPPKTYVSTTNKVELVFISDQAVTHSGFEATYVLDDAVRETSLSVASSSRVSPTTVAPEVEDVDFLPSCTVKQAVVSIFRCEYIFSKPQQYNGPETCRHQIDRAIRCVGNQIALCLLGGTNNKLDQLNLPYFNSKNILEHLNGLIITPNRPTDQNIGMFCDYTDRNESYPEQVINYFSFCERGTIHRLLDKTKDFYYSFVHAATESVICKSFQTLKNWILETSYNLCDYDVPPLQKVEDDAQKYISRVLKVALATIEEMNSTSCSDESVKTCVHGFGFGCAEVDSKELK